MSDNIQLSPEIREWLHDFQEKHEHPPRILHIGNIANNAYNNAKLLNKMGLDCDVICYDYYHIMGCPEWEDAAFDGEIKDQFFPNWRSVDLKGFKRPQWFAQGPLRFCIFYLIAKRKRHKLKAWFWWKVLGVFNSTFLSFNIYSKIKQGREFIKQGRYFLGKKLISFGTLRQQWYPIGSIAFHLILLITTLLVTVLALPFLVLALPLIPLKIYQKLYSACNPKKISFFDIRVDELVKLFAEAFPEREDKLSAADLEGFRGVMPLWQRLFEYYDMVIGYSTDGIYPLLANSRPYFAFEHGTIRNIPFESTTQGRLCALTYRLADMSLITNCDNIHSAHQLGLKSFKFIPHPVNESLTLIPELKNSLRTMLQEQLQSDFIVFHPPRQHWEPHRHPDWEKGNDFFIRGFAQFVKEINPKAGAVFVEWGNTVAQSKELIASLGITKRILWIPPQTNASMIRYIQATDLLADQFFLGAFGSTMPKALLHGCPAMLYLEEERHHWAFPEMPPVINVQTPDEIFEELQKLYQSLSYREELINKGITWYEKYHSNNVIASIFLTTFCETGI
jgi:hypothetical protein